VRYAGSSREPAAGHFDLYANFELLIRVKWWMESIWLIRLTLALDSEPLKLLSQ
jgi:hypothetical protein